MSHCFPVRCLTIALVLTNVASSLLAAGVDRPPTPDTVTFSNPIAAGQDPSVVKDGIRYLWCQSDTEGVAIYVSKSLTSLGEKHTIWEPPPCGPYSEQIWAPELIKLGQRWYIYVAASDGENANHRTYVLASKTEDPLGAYELHGPLYTGNHIESRQNNLWAIDMTVLQQGEKLFAVWSGWTTLDSDLQCLYIAPMDSPVSISGNRVKIADSDDFLWERVEETVETRGLNEAPQVLQREGRTFVVYSCGASWLPTYKLGLLELKGKNPLDPESWKKFERPVFESTEETFGVGHGSFIEVSDATWWHVYHAKDDVEPGWKRSIFAQPMSWREDGTPDFGQPVRRGVLLTFP